MATSDRPTLWLRTGSTSRGFHLQPGLQTVGRAADVDVQLDSNQVSSRHAELRWENGALSVIDLGSSNGTRVNGRSVSGWTNLADGDVVTFGPDRLTVELGSGAKAPPPPPPPPPMSFASPPPNPPSSPSPAAPPGDIGRGRRIFISYSHRDRRLAQRLHRHLDRAGWTPWMADENVAGGMEWANQIADGLGQTDAVVVLLTHNSLASPWVEREVAQSALAHIPMVPVSVDGVEPKGGLKLYLDTVQRISIADDGESDLWEVEQALLRRLSRGRKRSKATLQLRVGQLLQLIGGIGLIVAFAMFMFFAYQAISSDVPSSVGLGFDEAREQFEQNRRDSDQQFLRIASAFPVFLVSGIVAAIGTSMHRSALRKRM